MYFVSYFQTVVRGESKIKINDNGHGNGNGNGIPKTSSVARSNSLRSSSPRLRRDIRMNLPPTVPEEETTIRHSHPSSLRFSPHPHNYPPHVPGFFPSQDHFHSNHVAEVSYSQISKYFKLKTE